MMRILHISSEKTWRGGEQQIAYLIQGSAHVSHFVFCRKDSPFETYCQAHRIPCQTGSFHFAELPSTAGKLIRYCRENEVQLIHCHTGKAHLLAYAATLLGLQTPLVVSRRIATPPSGFFLTRARYDHAAVKRVICVSEDIRRTMSAYLADPGKAMVIHSGIDPGKFTPPVFSLREKLHLSNTTHIVGTIAALTAEKDLGTFLLAAREILKSDLAVHFLIVGGGVQHEELIVQANKLGIRDHVTFTGQVSNPYDYLQQFGLFLFTSRNEGLGTSILDAFACQVPVVASRTGGIPELVTDGQTGRLASPGKFKEFASAVCEVIGNPDESLRLTKNAARSLERFHYRHMANKTVTCYEQVLSSIKKAAL